MAVVSTSYPAFHTGVGSRVGAGLQALQEAVGMYMQLHQRSVENKRLQGALDLQQQEFADRKDKGDEDTLRYLSQNFGGQPVDAATEGLLSKHPEYYSTTEMHQPTTLGAKGGSFAAPAAPKPTLTNGIDATAPNTVGPQLGAAQPQDLPSVNNGPAQRVFRTPEDEKMRIAYYQAAAAASRQTAGDNTRRDIAGMQVAQRDRTAAKANALGLARVAMQQYGIDERSRTASTILDSLEQRFNAAQTNDELDRLVGLYGNPMFALGVAEPPAPTPRQGVTSPSPAASGGSRYTPIP